VVLWAHASLSLKWHLNWFSQFFKDNAREKYADHATCKICSNSLHLALLVVLATRATIAADWIPSHHQSNSVVALKETAAHAQGKCY